MKTCFASKEKFVPAALFVFLFLVTASLAPAQQYEYEPGEGVHQEEWYDPSDWFDNDAGIDYETDWYDYTYNYPETYAYQDQGVRGYYDAQNGYEAGDMGTYDYYDDAWFNDNAGDFDKWYE